jgi:hypothetical protein
VTRLAAGLLALAALVVSWSAWNAWRIDGVPERGVEDGSDAMIRTQSGVHESYDLVRVLAAVDKDPFHPERRRPGQRFRPPSDVTTTPASAAAPPPVLQLIGTAVAPDGGFAMCALSGGSARIVRIGERVGDWTLSRVTQGAAEFATPSGATVVIRIAKAGT